MKRRGDFSDQSLKHLKSEQEDLPSHEESCQFFSGLQFFILPAHFAKGRLNIFIKQIARFGGTTVPSNSSNISFIIVEETVDHDKVKKLTDFSLYSKIPVVKCAWLSKCIKERKLVEVDQFLVIKPLANSVPVKTVEKPLLSDVVNSPSPKIVSPSCSSSDAPFAQTSPDDSKEGASDQCVAKFQSKFACAHSSKTTAAETSPNAHITAELEKLLKVYKSKNDTWRVAGYQKAISAIQNYPQEIKSFEVARSIRGVGEKLASKVWEIISSGKLRKVEEICGSEETEVVTRFLGVWGAGPTTANAWYAQGFRSIEDLKKCDTLTRHQRVGVRLYDDLTERIPRDEVHRIHQYVSDCCAELREGLVTEVCGSYRRGRPTCGDVDVLVTHPDGVSNVFKPLLNLMRKKGFLTDDLVVQEDNGNQQKYLGVCRLPQPHSKHRRLDIIVVPYEEFAPALLYFTGSAHFNRSMRLLAVKLGMSLSEHGLRKNIVRQGTERLTDGIRLPTPSEESIFEHLGLPYRPPPERDH